MPIFHLISYSDCVCCRCPCSRFIFVGLPKPGNVPEHLVPPVVCCGMYSNWWRWWVTPVTPRIVIDVSYVTRINHQHHFMWQAKYLLRLEGDACSSAQCKRRLLERRINHEIFFWWQVRYLVKLHAIFGEVWGWLFLFRALYWAFHVLDYQMEYCSTE